MTIGTPLWDEFVANLKEVKVTVEDMSYDVLILMHFCDIDVQSIYQSSLLKFNLSWYSVK